MNRSQLKARARTSMILARPGVLMVCLAYWLMRWVVDWFTAVQVPVAGGRPDLAALVAGPRPVALLALSLVVSAVIQVLAAGHDYLYPLRISRDEPAGVQTLFELAARPWRFIALPLAVKLLTALPLLPALLFAAGNILARWGHLSALLGELSASQAAGVSPAMLQEMARGITALALPVPFWVALVAGAVLAVFMYLTYTLAIFLAIDRPELGLRQCLGQSRRLIQGRRGELLAISLSFVPWFLPLTIGLGVILSTSVWALMVLGAGLMLAVWALAYMHTTLANYYSLLAGRLRRQPLRRAPDAEALDRLFRPLAPPSEDEGDDAPPDTEADPEGDSSAEEERQRLIDEMWKR